MRRLCVDRVFGRSGKQRGRAPRRGTAARERLDLRLSWCRCPNDELVMVSTRDSKVLQVTDGEMPSREPSGDWSLAWSPCCENACEVRAVNQTIGIDVNHEPTWFSWTPRGQHEGQVATVDGPIRVDIRCTRASI